MAGILGWSVLLGAAFAWEGLALRAPGDHWLTLSDILRYVTRPALGRWLLFALWLWLGWHLFVRGWDFFMQDPVAGGGPGGQRRAAGRAAGWGEAVVPLVWVYGVLLGLLGYCARGAARGRIERRAHATARGGGWRGLVRHILTLTGAGYVLFLAGLALFDAAWGRDQTLLRDALGGGAFLAALAATTFLLLSVYARRRPRAT